jgi:hypothetical protein
LCAFRFSVQWYEIHVFIFLTRGGIKLARVSIPEPISEPNDR